MNGRTVKLIKKVAKKRGTTKPSQIRALKRNWYGLTAIEREQKRKEYQSELDN